MRASTAWNNHRVFAGPGPSTPRAIKNVRKNDSSHKKQPNKARRTDDEGGEKQGAVPVFSVEDAKGNDEHKMDLDVPPGDDPTL